jgi:hypothetical protein
MVASPFSVRMERSYLLPNGSVGTGCSLEEQPPIRYHRAQAKRCSYSN